MTFGCRSLVVYRITRPLFHVVRPMLWLSRANTQSIFWTLANSYMCMCVCSSNLVRFLLLGSPLKIWSPITIIIMLSESSVLFHYTQTKNSIQNCNLSFQHHFKTCCPNFLFLLPVSRGIYLFFYYLPQTLGNKFSTLGKNSKFWKKKKEI